MTTTPTIPPTAEELALAREICARLVEADSLTKLGAMFRAGRLDCDTRMPSALAAIRETTERAALLMEEYLDDPVLSGHGYASGAGTALRNNEHLKDSSHD